MYSYFSDLHVELLARGVLQPGEQLTAKTVVQYTPWWALGWIRRTYLVLATDQRLVLFDHRMAWLHQAQRLHAVESVPWHAVQEARVTGIFKKKLRIRAQAQTGPIQLKAVVLNALFGLLAPMRENMAGARAVAAAYQARAQLPISQQPAQLAFGAPPPLPAQNAPGYTSVPPPAPAPQQFGAAHPQFGTPAAQQFGAPAAQQFGAPASQQHGAPAAPPVPPPLPGGPGRSWPQS